MLNKQPIVFITKSFFISFCKKLNSGYNLLSIEEKRKMIFIEELLFEKSSVYIDLSEFDIAKLIYEMNNSINISDEEELLFIKYITKIIASNKLRSCLVEWRDYSTKKYVEVKSHRIKPNYILSHSDDGLSKELESEFGVITISKELSLKYTNIIVSVKVIEANMVYNPVDYLIGFSQCHSIVIEDPYILKEEYRYLKSLFESVLGSNFRLKPLQIMLITMTGQGNLNYINKLKEDLRGLIHLEHYEKSFVHDRNIYSNTYWISSDYGFKDKYARSATKWTSYPLGIYFSEFYCRISKSLNFLKHEKNKSDNYLALGIYS